MIYFVQAGVPDGFIKIGYTRKLETRLRGLRTGNPRPIVLLAVINGDEDREAELHEQFAAHRAEGEWFYPHPDLLAFIANLVRETITEPESETETRQAARRAFYADRIPKYHEALHEFALQMVRDAVDVCGGNLTAAAEALGLSRQGLIKVLGKSTRASRKGVGGARRPSVAKHPGLC